MDGIHDVGGEQGFGRVKPTAVDLPFEHDWEGRILGIVLAITRLAQWTVRPARA
jgi:nitrile hydratase subunit beta